MTIIAALLIAACSWLPAIQTLADSQVDAGLKRALITFASARGLNAVISVVQGTELSVQPLGVGLTLTLGQVLDPINDLVEQLSSLMLVVSVAFGIQKVLLLIGSHWLVSATVTAFVIVWAVLHWRNRSPPWMSRLILVLVMIRFAIPAVTIGSDFLFQQFMAKEYAESTKILEASALEVKGLAPKAPIGYAAADPATTKEAATPPAIASAPPASAPTDSLWKRLKDGIGVNAPGQPAAVDQKSLLEKLSDRVGAKLPSMNLNLDEIKKSLESLPDRIVKLIVVFLAQTIIIPLALTWALYVVVLGVLRPSKQ